MEQNEIRTLFAAAALMGILARGGNTREAGALCWAAAEEAMKNMPEEVCYEPSN